MTVSELQSTYRHGNIVPASIIEEALRQIEKDGGSVWINRNSKALALAQGLTTTNDKPLFGVPFAVKDNIDVDGAPTTAACPDFLYRPDKSAFTVDRLINAGAIPVGKTNMDQFATGLVGTRSPYGIVHNAYNDDYIAGGSSSGSALAVAKKHVPFALGTDTAGSGRVPAAFNNLVGLKPSRGLLSTGGVVPACRSLDCVSIFAHTIDDARTVFQAAASYDENDPWSRQGSGQDVYFKSRFGVPSEESLEFFGNTEYKDLYFAAIERLEGIGFEKYEIDYQVFAEAAALLYQGPWVAERTAALEAFICKNEESFLDVTRSIISGGFKHTAVDTFKGLYRLRELQRAVEPIWNSVDFLLTPTAPTIYTINEVIKDPIQTNTNLGYYTNFMNLLDLCGLAVPAGFTQKGLPFGVTLSAPAFEEKTLLDIGECFLNQTTISTQQSGYIPFAVCGAHLDGFPLNHQITERGGILIKEAVSAPNYRTIALEGETPRPGMIHVDEAGSSFALEIWQMPITNFGSFVSLISAPLAMGTVSLQDGSEVKGFVCEGNAKGLDISSYGSWKRYVADCLDGC